METTPRHNNHTNHVSLEDIKREAKSNTDRKNEIEDPGQRLFVEYALQPLEDLYKYAKASGEYGNRGDEWDIEDPKDGIDGAAELSDIAMERLQNPEAEEALRNSPEWKNNWKDKVVVYMQVEANRLKVKSQLDPELFKDGQAGQESPLIGRLESHETSLKEEINQLDASEENEVHRNRLNRQIEYINSFKQDYAVTNDVQDVVRNYVKGKKFTDTLQAKNVAMTDEQRVLRDNEEAIFDAQQQRNRRDVIVYQILLKQERLSQVNKVDDSEVSPNANSESVNLETEQAAKNLAELRSQLAELNAKREKRFAGMGAWKNEERYSDKVKKLYADYHDASRALFTLENKDFLADPSVEVSEKVLKIAEHTVTEAGLLDTQILDNYKNKNTRFGKLIERYGNLGKVSKIAVGVGASALAGVLTGGVGTALVSGSLMAASFEDRRRKQRSAGEDMITLNASDLAEQYATSATLKDVFEGAHLTARNAFEDRIHKEQMKRVKRVAGSLAVGATIGLVTNHLPGMDGLFGGDNAHAATQPDMATVDPTNTPYPTPEIGGVADTAANFGPNTVYVSPNDGLFSVFQQMNIPQDQWSGLLDKVGPELVSHGDAYVMPNGDPGLTQVGQLSQSAFETIMRAR